MPPTFDDTRPGALVLCDFGPGYEFGVVTAATVDDDGRRLTIRTETGRIETARQWAPLGRRGCRLAGSADVAYRSAPGPATR